MKTTPFQVHLAPKVYSTWQSWWPLEHNNLWHKGPKLTLSHGFHAPLWNVSPATHVTGMAGVASEAMG